MELGKWRERIKECWGKYKYVLVILLVGMVFMTQPKVQKAEDTIIQPETVTSEPELAERLEDILMNIHGAGKVMVLLSVEKGESVTYQTDVTASETDKGTDSRSQTVLVTNSQRNETGLIYQKNPPTYKGAIILAQGADAAKVKLEIVEAVSKVTGLGANDISVLKMK